MSRDYGWKSLFFNVCFDKKKQWAFGEFTKNK